MIILINKIKYYTLSKYLQLYFLHLKKKKKLIFTVTQLFIFGKKLIRPGLLCPVAQILARTTRSVDEAIN